MRSRIQSALGVETPSLKPGKTAATLIATIRRAACRAACGVPGGAQSVTVACGCDALSPFDWPRRDGVGTTAAASTPIDRKTDSRVVVSPR